MAKSKNNRKGWVTPKWFKMFTIQWEMLTVLSDEDLGAGLKAAFRYLNTGDDEAPAALSNGALLAFTYMKPSLIESIKRYNKSIQDGIKGADIRWHQGEQTKDSHPIEPYGNPIESLSNPIGYDAEERRIEDRSKMIDDRSKIKDDRDINNRNLKNQNSVCINNVCVNNEGNDKNTHIHKDLVVIGKPSHDEVKECMSAKINELGIYLNGDIDEQVEKFFNHNADKTRWIKEQWQEWVEAWINNPKFPKYTPRSYEERMMLQNSYR